MTDTVTPTQADKDALIKISRLITSMHVNLRDEKDVAGDGLAILARHRLAAEATQAAEIARLQERVAGLTGGGTFLHLREEDRPKAAMDLDDASLLKWVRWVLATCANNYVDYAEDQQRSLMEYTSTMAIVTLAQLVADTKANEAKFIVEGAVWPNQRSGEDWEVIIRRAALSAQPSSVDDVGLYLIIKNGMYYRPNAQGYTSSVAEAGRYTLDEAISHSHPNGPDGPRDGISYEPVPNCAAQPSEQERGE